MQTKRASHAWLLATTALFAASAVVPAVLSASAAPVASVAHAEHAFQWIPGYSVQGGWLCYEWSDGAGTYLHCTQHWSTVAGRYVSGNPSWVPSEGTPAPVSAAPAPAAQPLSATSPAGVTYTVQPGDWLSTIAARSGTNWPAIWALNRAQISDPNVIQVGQVLTLPSGSSAPTAPSAPAPQAAAGAPGVTGVLPGDFCQGQSRDVWASFNGNRWDVPPGCMAGTFYPNAANYFSPNVPWGQCSWWPTALLHVGFPSALALHGAPKVHSIAYWNVAANGGGSAHFAFVESISPDGQWVLTSQMNMYWRGGGFGKVIFVYEPVWSVTGFYW